MIHGINGPVVSLLGDPGFQMNEMVYVGKENLVGEVIGLTSEKTTIQVYEETSGIKVIENVGPDKNRTVSLRIVDENNPALPGREAVKVRGIYISGPMAGSTELFQNILDSAAGTEINTVVIDFKDDQGRITCPVDSPVLYYGHSSLLLYHRWLCKKPRCRCLAHHIFLRN